MLRIAVAFQQVAGLVTLSGGGGGPHTRRLLVARRPIVFLAGTLQASGPHHGPRGQKSLCCFPVGLSTTVAGLTCIGRRATHMTPFILFVNDLHLHMSKCDLNLYADDTNLYTVGKTVNKIQTQLSNDMCTLYWFCKTNGLSINFIKTACMLVSTSQKRSHVHSCGLDVNVFDVQIPVCKSHKFFGVVMNETLDWTAQINDVAKYRNYSLFVLKKIKS